MVLVAFHGADNCDRADLTSPEGKVLHAVGSQLDHDLQQHLADHVLFGHPEPPGTPFSAHERHQTPNPLVEELAQGHLGHVDQRLVEAANRVRTPLVDPAQGQGMEAPERSVLPDGTKRGPDRLLVRMERGQHGGDAAIPREVRHVVQSKTPMPALRPAEVESTLVAPPLDGGRVNAEQLSSLGAGQLRGAVGTLDRIHLHEFMCVRAG